MMNAAQRKAFEKKMYGDKDFQINHILYVEAKQSYSKVKLSDGSDYLVTICMKNNIDKMNNCIFFYCHRSFCVNSTKIIAKTRTHYIMSDGRKIPISKSHRL